MASDFFEQKVLNENTAAGISDYEEYEKAFKYSAAMDEAERRAKTQDLIDRGVIESAEKLSSYHKKLEE